MLRSQPRAVRILGRKALSRQAKQRRWTGTGSRSSRACYAVGGPFIRQDGSSGPVRATVGYILGHGSCESSVVAARTHGQTTPPAA